MGKKVIILAGALVVLAACTPGGKAVNAAVEGKVDEAIDFTIDRFCNAPIDTAIRMFERHPALGRAAFETCPDTYGRLRAVLFEEAIRDLQNRGG